ncbi:conserved hypothetical protein [Histoplasma capsulatum H143]|uniref:SAP domain-containing protein n=1 Tax=Ajellomyces capsulatus (strain H143) TaxID=544712 RepID=C6H881_AJECH|nr:conserved hypothetical protein [Histoplasma capsulatum H143]
MAPAASPTTWLPSLKVRQLQRLASLMGILSSGTKPVLIERLDRVLHGESRPVAQNASLEETFMSDKEPARILSIDMGIRNLAFAHLLVPPRQAGVLSSPILNAWCRLSVSSLASNSVLDFHMGEEMKPKGKIAKGRKTKALDILDAGQCDGIVLQNEQEKESFAPKLYAAHAYTLMSSLLATYQPTHILIERQRFRSGGSSAVQEWTIRVGVFEGMLYAVLRAIQQERKGDVANIVVQGVEPQRVMKYWMDDEEDLSPEPKAKRTAVPSTKHISQSMSPNRRKQIKIDLIGRLLSSCTGSHASGTQQANLGDHIGIQFSTDRQVNEVVNAYLKKCGKKTRKANIMKTGGTFIMPISSSSSSSSSNIAPHSAADGSQTLEIGKLDDLADCLLQAMTWLEWQNTRQTIARYGLEAVSSKVGC